MSAASTGHARLLDEIKALTSKNRHLQARVDPLWAFVQDKLGVSSEEDEEILLAAQLNRIIHKKGDSRLTLRYSPDRVI